VADATAESIRKVNEAIQQGGESYFRYKQIEMLPEIAPFIADALAKARLVTISGGGGESAPRARRQHHQRDPDITASRDAEQPRRIEKIKLPHSLSGDSGVSGGPRTSPRPASSSMHHIYFGGPDGTT
jgi:uncharacterized membrane protein YqiK